MSYPRNVRDSYVQRWNDEYSIYDAALPVPPKGYGSTGPGLETIPIPPVGEDGYVSGVCKYKWSRVYFMIFHDNSVCRYKGFWYDIIIHYIYTK